MINILFLLYVTGLSIFLGIFLFLDFDQTFYGLEYSQISYILIIIMGLIFLVKKIMERKYKNYSNEDKKDIFKKLNESTNSSFILFSFFFLVLFFEITLINLGFILLAITLIIVSYQIGVILFIVHNKKLAFYKLIKDFPYQIIMYILAAACIYSTEIKTMIGS